MTKVLIFDSGTLINLSMNGFLYILEELKKKSGIKFIIPHDVKYEVIDRPLKVPRFKLGAMRIRKLLNSGILELPESLGVSHNVIKGETKRLTDLLNHSVQMKGKWIDIVSPAEISCLALSSELRKKDIETLIGIDERTTRILTERPKNLEKIMTKKMHQEVSVVKSDFSELRDFRFIRSTELVYVAHKLGILRIKDQGALEAALLATKFKGSSVSWDEIRELKKL
jgi:hypothetical protein